MPPTIKDCSIYGCQKRQFRRRVCIDHWCDWRASQQRITTPRKSTDHDRVMSLRPHTRFQRAKRDAYRRGKSWDISERQYIPLSARPCFYCNSKYDNCGSGLDRIDNARGYDGDNVVPCCANCNRVRGHLLTVEETKAAIFALQISRRRKDIWR